MFYLVHRLRRRRGISIRTIRLILMIFIVIVDFPRNKDRYVIYLNNRIRLINQFAGDSAMFDMMEVPP